MLVASNNQNISLASDNKISTCVSFPLDHQYKQSSLSIQALWFCTTTRVIIDCMIVHVAIVLTVHET